MNGPRERLMARPGAIGLRGPARRAGPFFPLDCAKKAADDEEGDESPRGREPTAAAALNPRKAAILGLCTA